MNHYRMYALKENAKQYLECFGLPADELLLCLPLSLWLSRFLLEFFSKKPLDSHPAVTAKTLELRNKLLYFYTEGVPKDSKIQRYFAKQGIRIALALTTKYGNLPQEMFTQCLENFFKAAPFGLRQGDYKLGRIF